MFDVIQTKSDPLVVLYTVGDFNITAEMTMLEAMVNTYARHEK